MFLTSSSPNFWNRGSLASSARSFSSSAARKQCIARQEKSTPSDSLPGVRTAGPLYRIVRVLYQKSSYMDVLMISSARLRVRAQSPAPAHPTVDSRGGRCNGCWLACARLRHGRAFCAFRRPCSRRWCMHRPFNSFAKHLAQAASRAYSLSTTLRGPCTSMGSTVSFSSTTARQDALRQACVNKLTLSYLVILSNSKIR